MRPPYGLQPAMADPNLVVRVHPGLDEIDATAWNALITDNNPFLKHEFLYAMEEHGCVGEHFGWIPMHLAVYADEILVGAMPLYRKLNSYGEFVFDHAWEEAWRRVGLSYFPKLVSAVPYTPAVGSRMLTKPGLEQQIQSLFLHTARMLATEYEASGVHWLFPDSVNLAFLQEQGLVMRHDCQFHWRNRGYRTFEDFLEKLSARKRKRIRRERRKVEDAGVTLRRLDGRTASGQDWRDFAHFYDRLYEEKWGMPTFNQAFFKAVAQAFPQQVLLVMADYQGECVAGALMFASDTRLYGRHWGCTQEIDSLHFEACYYQGIEYCIEHGLQVFEPGAQGEHKVARGFEPVQTASAHWVAEQGFRESIQRFARLERHSVEAYMQQMQQQTAYRKESS